MIGKLNHVAIVVPDLQVAAAIYRDTLGATLSEEIDLPEHGVTTIFVELPNTKIELLLPLGDDSPIAKFLEKNPSGGIHHICYEVDDIIATAAAIDQPLLASIPPTLLTSALTRSANTDTDNDNDNDSPDSETAEPLAGDELAALTDIDLDVSSAVEAGLEAQYTRALGRGEAAIVAALSRTPTRLIRIIDEDTIPWNRDRIFGVSDSWID